MVQPEIFETLLTLPISTPHYTIIRDETGRNRVGTFFVLERPLGCWEAIIRMRRNRYPRICYDQYQLLTIPRRGTSNEKFNWISQLREVLVKLGYSNL